MHLTESDKNDIVRMTKENARTSEIAEWIGCSNGAVNAYRRKIGLVSCVSRETAWTREDDVVLVEAFERKLPYHDIAKMMGRTIEALRNRVCKLRRLGIIKSRRPSGRKSANVL